VLQSHKLPDEDGDVSVGMLRERNIAGGFPIDEWVIQNYGGILRGCESYLAQGFPRRRNVATYRYEDIIFNKQDWAADIVNWYEWDIPDEVIKKAVALFDVVPEAERPDQHIRQVHPGNYKRHLSPAIASRIAAQFDPYIRAFGYY
jgi:hypothetical protein